MIKNTIHQINFISSVLIRCGYIQELPQAMRAIQTSPTTTAAAQSTTRPQLCPLLLPKTAIGNARVIAAAAANIASKARHLNHQMRPVHRVDSSYAVYQLGTQRPRRRLQRRVRKPRERSAAGATCGMRLFDSVIPAIPTPK
jgi:hypothetical protein